MHRGSRLARAGARLSRALLAGVNPGLRSARAPGRLAAAAWPSAPAAGASGGAPPKPPARGSAATADGLLDLLGEEDEETRFKRGSPFDRGPGAARREGAAWEGGAGGARGAWGATGGGGGIGGGSGGRWRQGGGGGGGGGSGGWRPPRDDSAPPPWSPGGAPPSSSSSPSFSSSRQAALEDGPAPSVGDFLTLAPSALAALPRAAAERMASASARAESVASPYERGAYERDDKGVAFTRADVGARALPDGTGVSLAPSDEPGAPAARGGASSAPADGVVTQDVRPLAAWEAKTVLQALKDDADALEAPTMLAALARDGTLAPLDDDDAARLAALALPARGAPPAVLEHPAARAAIVLKATLVRRALRASYTREGIERFAAATLLQQGDADDVFNAQPSPFDARRGDAYGEGDDPLLDSGTPLPLDLRGVTFVSSLSWSTVPNGASVDRRAAAIARPSALGLPPAALSWLLAIAGPRYDAKKQRLRVSSDAHATAARNRRAVLETLVALAVEARRLAGKHGALPVPRTMPKYSHTV